MATSLWSPIQAYGVVIYPFAPAGGHSEEQGQPRPGAGGGGGGVRESGKSPQSPSAAAATAAVTAKQVPLEVGDDVFVTGQLGGWYSGYVYHGGRFGIFPANHVHLRAADKNRKGEFDSLGGRPSQDELRGAVDSQPKLSDACDVAPHGPDQAAAAATDRDTSTSSLDAAGKSYGLGVARQKKGRPQHPALPAAFDATQPPASLQIPPLPPHITKSGVKEPLVDAIADALREWLPYLYLYLRKQDYALCASVIKHIKALLQGRRQLIAENLSQDGLVKLRRELVSQMVSANRLQKLDIIVRQPDLGILADDEILSVHQHRHVYLEVKAAVASACGLGETAEFHFSLYNSRAEKEKFITESYCLVLNSSGIPRDESKAGKMCTLFIDLSHRDMNENLWLLCRIIRNGRMKYAEKDRDLAPSEPGPSPLPKEFAQGKACGTTFRRPFGVAAFHVGALLEDKKEVDCECDMKIYVPKDELQFAQLHEAIIGRCEDLEESKKADKLRIALRSFSGDLNQVVGSQLGLLQGIPYTARREFPDVVMPGITRNELYVTLVSAEFQQGRKTAGKNVEVVLEVRHANGETLADVISRGAGEPMMTVFESIILYHSNYPLWEETVKLVIPLDKFEKAHIFLTFRHCSSNEDKTEKAFAYVFLPLVQGKQCVVHDGLHRLHLYKVEKAENVATLSDAAGSFAAPEQNLTGENAQMPQPPRTTLLKDTCTVRTFLCSTKYTQNNNLLNLLNWKDMSKDVGQAQSEQIVTEVLRCVRNIGELEVAKFLRDILDALFDIITSKLNNRGQLDDLAFPALVFILGIVSDRRFNNFSSVLNNYIEEHFSARDAVFHLIDPLKRLLDDATNPGKAKELLVGSIKVWEYLFGLIIRARLLQREYEAQNNDPLANANERHFLEMLSSLFDTINGMMRLSQAETMITKTIALQNFPSIIPDLVKVFSPIEVVHIATAFTDSASFQRGGMTVFKTQLIHSFVKGPLFDNEVSRREITKAFVRWMGELIQPSDNAQWRDTMRASVLVVLEFLEKFQRIVVMTGDSGEGVERQNIVALLSLLPTLLSAYRA
ncbi:MAG: C2 domain in Dock180 and Zizimin proteins-domain-containing protein, partial [Olpidium bornovanus]